MAGIAVDRDLTAAAAAAPREVSLAIADDDREVRALLRRSVMPGPVRIALTREPNYFAGEGLAGAQDFTVVARQAGRIVTIGKCSIHHWHRNGRLQRIGYLGELRVAPEARASARILRDGYAFFRDVIANASVDGFVTCIASDNARARRVLEHGGRMGLPRYGALASLVTLVAPVGACAPSVGVTEAMCQPGECAELTAFLRSTSPQAQLTLRWDAALWTQLARHGVTPGDFCVVRRGGRIVAAGAVWDQRPFHQTVVDSYDGALKFARPLLNAVQAVRGLPALPSPGSVLALGALLGAGVADVGDWPLLWQTLAARARALGVHWMAVTRAVGDAELEVLRRLTRAREYSTSLYEVRWRDNRSSWRDIWDQRPFRPEVGLL